MTENEFDEPVVQMFQCTYDQYENRENLTPKELGNDKSTTQSASQYFI